MNKDIMQMTIEELRKLENMKPINLFDSIVIVPMGYLHDSGYRCMKYILMFKNEIVGVVGGGSDVIHINGIGGYGDNFYKTMKNGKKGYDWRLDCLPKSQCLRLFSDELCQCDDYIGTSDFIFYVKENAKRK